MAQEVTSAAQNPPAPASLERASNRPVFVPPSDIYETRDNIVVLAEMPGVGPDGVDITLERRVLTIRGRSSAVERAGYQRVHSEYAHGDYERVFTLSENIDRDRIEATLRDGVLHLVLPKAETARPKRIELRTS
ncbi:MAG: Hsp20/alpha crystallin family protein [Alphaproteobacteria bacterium]|nr:Hsp20/alpha crystallin family protein [Alphaproteobacteria bacterium]